VRVQTMNRSIQVIRSRAEAKTVTADVVITSYALLPATLPALRTHAFYLCTWRRR
jgi:hypothetical protein